MSHLSDLEEHFGERFAAWNDTAVVVECEEPGLRLTVRVESALQDKSCPALHRAEAHRVKDHGGGRGSHTVKWLPRPGVLSSSSLPP
jgi:hypothetical protein